MVRYKTKSNAPRQAVYKCAYLYLFDILEFVELINADSLFLHKPHTPNYRKGS